MLVRFEAFHQAAVTVLTENCLADCRCIQVAEANVDIRLVWRWRHAHLVVADRQALNTAFLFHRRPVGRSGDRCIGHRRALYRLDDADLAGDDHRRTHHHLILGDHRDCRAADGIKSNDVITGLSLAYLNFAADRLAKVLIDESDQLFFGNAEQQNGFGVAQYANTRDDSCGIHTNQRNDRLAGIGWNIDDVGG